MLCKKVLKSLRFKRYLPRSQNFSINYWIEKGAPSRKIAMGVPLYGQAFELSDTKNNGLNARAPGPGKAGEHTRSAGFLAYYEVSAKVLNNLRLGER